MKSERRNSFVIPPAKENPTGDIEEVGDAGGWYHGGGVDGGEWENMEIVQQMMGQDYTTNGDNGGNNHHGINGGGDDDGVGDGEYENGHGDELNDHDTTTINDGETGGNFPAAAAATTETDNIYLKETQDIVNSKAEKIPMICENVMSALKEYVSKMAEAKAEYERIAGAEHAESNRLRTIEMEVDGATSHFLTEEERDAAMALTQTQTQNDFADGEEEEEEEDNNNNNNEDEDLIGTEHENNEHDNDEENHGDDLGGDGSGIGGSDGSDGDDLNEEQNKENIHMDQEEEDNETGHQF